MSKLLTVFGATGFQGGALINYILGHPELSTIFNLRGVTRDASKPAALELKEKGVEIVQADLNDPSSLNKAIRGSYSVFVVTNYWEAGSGDVEVAQGKAAADACIAEGVTQIIWSSLPSISLMTKGEITTAEHFDSKAEVENYIRTLDIRSMFFMAAWYMQNNVSFMRPQLVSPGRYEWWSDLPPDSQLPLIDIRDAGKFIAPALLKPDVYNGKRFTSATQFYTFKEIVETWSKVTGKQVVQRKGGSILGGLPAEVVAVLSKIQGLITTYAYFGPTGQGDLDWTLQQLKDKPTSWEQFVEDYQPWFQD